MSHITTTKANKIDLVGRIYGSELFIRQALATGLRQVTESALSTGQDFAKDIGASYAETSALTGQGVSEVFQELCLQVR